MVSQVDHFDTIFVSTEFEALILENSLIKQHMPRYNILLKDDKGYPFVRLGTEHYPRFRWSASLRRQRALLWPVWRTKRDARGHRRDLCAFRLPTCSRKFPRDIGKERPLPQPSHGARDAFCRGTPDEDDTCAHWAGRRDAERPLPSLNARAARGDGAGGCGAAL